MNREELKAEILRIKKEKNTVILAHYYQEEDIQEIADFVGDSYGLSVEASKTEAPVILFCGVHFMAETAKILNPDKKVLLPDLNAGCSLADGCKYDDFKAFKDEHPDHEVVMYINCSAEVKSISDYICTSSNAVKIVNSIPADKKVIFAPDRNLGRYVKKATGRDLVLWNGKCIVHEAFSFDKIMKLILEYPEADLIAHPESTEEVIELAQFVGSTAAMIKYVKESPKEQFIIATEAGILHKMKEGVPEKTLIPAPVDEDNTCACSECAFMKMNTLQKVYDCLVNESPSIDLTKEVMDAARLPIERMIQITESAK
ncbi:MAG: quinolinate synthase NadA [Crocinitomicaceae bacterium]|nr:quinolinate synthase NadA [Crocinitomicaceae bacterium]